MLSRVHTSVPSSIHKGIPKCALHRHLYAMDSVLDLITGELWFWGPGLKGSVATCGRGRGKAFPEGEEKCLGEMALQAIYAQIYNWWD